MQETAVARYRLHRNVPLALVTVLLDMSRRSLATGVDAYVLLLPAGTNTRVGILEGCVGVCNLVCTVAAGIAADRYGRSIVLRCAAVVILLSGSMIVVTLFALEINVRYYGLVAAAALQGIGNGLYTTPFEALFGDSTPSGDERNRYYSYKGSMYTLGLATGPLTAILIFLARGDTWTRPELVIIMLTAVGIGVAQVALVCFFRDVHKPVDGSLLDTLPAPEEAVEEEGAACPAGPQLDALPPSEPVNAATVVAEATKARSCCGFTRAHVAPLIAVSNLLLGLGSGMSAPARLHPNPRCCKARSPAIATMAGLCANPCARSVQVCADVLLDGARPLAHPNTGDNRGLPAHCDPWQLCARAAQPSHRRNRCHRAVLSFRLHGSWCRRFGRRSGGRYRGALGARRADERDNRLDGIGAERTCTQREARPVEHGTAGETRHMVRISLCWWRNH